MVRVQLYMNGRKTAKGDGYSIAAAEEDAAKRVVEDWEAKSYYFRGIRLPKAKILPSPDYVEVGEDEEVIWPEVKK